NLGLLVVGAGASLTADPFTLNVGTILLTGTLNINGFCGICDANVIVIGGGGVLVNDTAGVIAGNGTLNVSGLDNFGRLQPGAATQPHAIGTMTINGDVALEPGSVLAIDIASATSYDQLAVSGFTSFSGLPPAPPPKGLAVST